MLEFKLRLVQILRVQGHLEEAWSECKKLLELQLDTLGAGETYPTVLLVRHEMICLSVVREHAAENGVRPRTFDLRRRSQDWPGSCNDYGYC